MFMHLTGKCIGTLTAKQIPLRLSLSVSGEFVGKHHTLRLRVMEEQFFVFLTLVSGVTRGVWGVQPPPRPEIPKALQNRAKLNPIVKTVKNC